MNPFDEDDEGEISIGESSDVERRMTPNAPKAPSVKTFDDVGNFESAGDVHPDTLRAFVACVIYANVALLFVALGPMVWFFEGWTRVGPALFAGGILAAIRTYQTYREWEQGKTEREAETDAGDSESADDGDVGDAGEGDVGDAGEGDVGDAGEGDVEEVVVDDGDMADDPESTDPAEPAAREPSPGAEP